MRQYSGIADAVRQMARVEGPSAFFKGLSPALLRQSTYGTLRYGLYEPIKGTVCRVPDHQGRTVSSKLTFRSTRLGILSQGQREGSVFWQKILAGTISGAVSSSLCNPTDVVSVLVWVLLDLHTPRPCSLSTRSCSRACLAMPPPLLSQVKVRMQAEKLSTTSGAKSSGPRYRGTLHAFLDIYRTEGLRGLYRGVGPTAARASVGAATELATYDDLKARLVRVKLVEDGFPAHLAGSLAAGFVSTLANSPFDVVKSRVMNQPVGSDGRGLVYSGMVDCFAKGVRAEGVFAFWKGFWPNYARVGPRVTIIFLVFERLREWFDSD